MESSFTPIEQMLNIRATRHKDFPLQEIMLTRLCMHMQSKLLELSAALGSSRTNATRIADELEKRGWIERRESDNDRRCLHLHLTEKGNAFLRQVLPPQHQSLQYLWSSLNNSEKAQLESLTRKLLNRLDQMDEEEVISSLSHQ
ncbi:MAG: transcriptional repressor MprA [Pantoea sp.]|nr:transcriptional repressor MprA [Pantoea sp.]